MIMRNTQGLGAGEWVYLTAGMTKLSIYWINRWLILVRYSENFKVRNCSYLTLHLPQKFVHFSHVQFCVSHTLNTDSTLAANTFWLSGDHETRFSPPPFARFTLVATPMGMSQVIKLLSAGEAEIRKLPWGLQEIDVTGAWPGDVSTRTQLARNL